MRQQHRTKPRFFLITVSLGLLLVATSCTTPNSNTTAPAENKQINKARDAQETVEQRNQDLKEQLENPEQNQEENREQ